MATSTNLDVQYHQQDTDYFCGAACAQMVLDQVGAGLLDQANLYNDNNSHSNIEEGWYTAPDGLEWTMNNRKPATFTNPFVLFALDNEDAISRKIVWTIHHYRIAPIAMVLGSRHWIVIRGFDASANPMSAADNSYTINGFDVNDPWPATPAPAPPPPHTMGDRCGSGGDYGTANGHISYATWKNTYMTGVSWGHWNGKFVAVCDPDLPPATVGVSHQPQHFFSGDRIIQKKEAIQVCHAGLDQYELYQKEWWRKALSQSKPGEPVLVHRLDQPDNFYYLVPFETSRNNVTALISVDARYGDYNQGAILSEPRPHLSNAYNVKKIVKNVVNKRFQLPGRLGKIFVRPEAFSLYPTLVWMPCLESLSSYWPFHMITVGLQKIYIRIDGVIFTELHDNVHGI